MTGFTNYYAQASLNQLTGYSPSVTRYITLFTAVGTDAGTGFTEVSGGSYARAATIGGSSSGTWNASSGTAPSVTSNSLSIAFPTATAPWGTVIAWGIYDASSSGNLLAWDYISIGNFNWLPATVSAASPGVIDSPGHGYSVNDTVIFSLEYGGAAPSFSASNFTGQLIVAHSTTDTFDVTNGGTPVNTSSSGDGSVRKIVPTIVGSGATPTVPSGALLITCA